MEVSESRLNIQAEAYIEKLVDDLQESDEKRKLTDELKRRIEEKIVQKVLAKKKFPKLTIEILRTEKHDFQLKKDCVIISNNLEQQKTMKKIHKKEDMAILTREIREHAKTDQSFVKICLELIVKIATDNKKAISNILNLEGLKLAMSLLENRHGIWVWSDYGVKAHAASLLACLMVDSTPEIVSEEIVKNDGVKVFATLIGQNNNDCVDGGAHALNNLLILNSEAREQALAEVNLVTDLMIAIRRDSYECLTRCRCAAVLLNKCKWSKKVIQKCKKNFLIQDLVLLKEEIKDDMRKAQQFRKCLKELIDKLSG